jgi:hypothetical protein
MASVEDAILDALAGIPAGKSIPPDQVAKAIDLERWRRILPQVKAAAVGLARTGKVDILRHNKPVNPAEPIKGVYRLRTTVPSAEDLPADE